MNLPSLALLDVVGAGRILFPDQHSQKPLTKNALTLRVLTLKENKGLPLMKVKNKYWISVRALEKWLSEQGQ